MPVIDELENDLLLQPFSHSDDFYATGLIKYKRIAAGYAEIEKCIAVLSDMRTNKSYIYYGACAPSLGVDMPDASVGEINSIWEDTILKRVYADDLHQKHVQELRFFHFVKRQPVSRRSDFHLVNRLRMKDAFGNLYWVMHRLFYISAPNENNLWLALCLYSPMVDMTMDSYRVINSCTGQLIQLDERDDEKILSAREKQVLRLIDQGMMSKHIADMLSISIHTVSRHRQEILKKLQVNNSIEACRVAKELHLL